MLRWKQQSGSQPEAKHFVISSKHFMFCCSVPGGLRSIFRAVLHVFAHTTLKKFLKKNTGKATESSIHLASSRARIRSWPVRGAAGPDSVYTIRRPHIRLGIAASPQ